jgi:hypothetical protein
MASEPQWSIAYSALYLDEKESFETAEIQINENIDEAAAVGKDPTDIYIAVDIIATPGQIASGVAKKYAERIMAFVNRTFPQSGRAIGITDDDRRRPLRDLLITHNLQDSDIDGKHLSILE